jgi:ribosome biogenesis GTPase
MAHPAETDQDPDQNAAAETSPRSETGETTRAFPEEGLVIAIAPGFFEVSAGPDALLCTLRGRLRKPRPTLVARRGSSPPNGRIPGSARPRAERVQAEPEEAPVRIAPGDRVLITRLGGGQGVIEDVLPRRTVLSRARSESGGEHVMLANLDHAVLVFAMREPTPHFGMLDRYLALCEHAGIAVTICLNKVDLGMPDDVRSAVDLYSTLGYRVLLTSAASGIAVDDLRKRLHDRTSLLTGPSGVGKSSLMNVLVPDAAQRTAEISEATGKGRHTTTGVRLLPLPGGGWLADSAGIRELALWNVPSEQLANAFVELRPFADACEYENCEHSDGETGCALRAALADGRVTPARFASFERLLHEAQNTEVPVWEQARR